MNFAIATITKCYQDVKEHATIFIYQQKCELNTEYAQFSDFFKALRGTYREINSVVLIANLEDSCCDDEDKFTKYQEKIE